MSEDKKQDFKKSFPNSFIWFLMAAFLFTLMIQNLIDTKFAKVSFSYQLEHLVNLQLIQPEESRKTALNDNLVTFSGKFRDRQTDEGKNRFKYLDLLHSNHELNSQKEHLQKELTTLKDKISHAAEWYLTLTGMPIPPNGYAVVDDLYNVSGLDTSVIITKLPQKNIMSLATLSSEIKTLGSSPSQTGVQSFGLAIEELIKGFRSPPSASEMNCSSKTLKT